MTTYTIYIGSDNRTHRLERTKIERILARRHDGFTVSEAVGYWKGLRERTAVVSLAGERLAVLASIADLKAELEQDAIAYQRAPEMRFV
jgi:hypothetical protein